VADAKSEYLAARLSNELQQDLAERDRAAWDNRAIPEQQYIRSRNAAAQTATFSERDRVAASAQSAP
jgi:cobalt-zinc-cadmium efflux system membrane fusion protein